MEARRDHPELVSNQTSKTSYWTVAVSYWLAKFKSITGIDRAIGFTVLARGWSALAGVVTILLIADFLNPSEQGYYYTFFSMVSLQVFFELGFFFVVLQMAAHERAQLTLGANGVVEGDDVAHSRLASILQQSVRWYSVAAVLMIAILLPGGLHFFGALQHLGVAVVWKGPWCLLVLAAALAFQLDPLCAFVEGCGFVPHIARMRLTQALLGSALAWTALATHHGLFAPAMLIVGQATAQVIEIRRLSLL